MLKLKNYLFIILINIMQKINYLLNHNFLYNFRFKPIYRIEVSIQTKKLNISDLIVSDNLYELIE